MNIMVIDCEFNQPSKKTIQIGAAVFKAKSGELLDTFETYVDPGEPISERIIELTGITDKDVAGAPKIKEAYVMLKEFHSRYKCFMNPIVWGSGVSNDSLAIYNEADPGEPNFMGFRVVDAKTLYQSYAIFKNQGLKGGLQKTCEKLGIKFEGRGHTALADAINTFSVWHFLMTRFYENFKTHTKAIHEGKTD